MNSLPNIRARFRSATQFLDGVQIWQWFALSIVTIGSIVWSAGAWLAAKLTVLKGYGWPEWVLAGWVIALVSLAVFAWIWRATNPQPDVRSEVEQLILKLSTLAEKAQVLTGRVERTERDLRSAQDYELAKDLRVLTDAQLEALSVPVLTGGSADWSSRFESWRSSLDELAQVLRIYNYDRQTPFSVLEDDLVGISLEGHPLLGSVNDHKLRVFLALRQAYMRGRTLVDAVKRGPYSPPT